MKTLSRTVLLLSVAAFICFSAPCNAADPQQEAGIIQEARRIASMGERIGALQILQDFVNTRAESPLIPDALFEIARIHEQLGQRELAAVHYTRIHENHPDNPLAPQGLLSAAGTYRGVGRADDAKRLLLTLIEHYPETPQTTDARFRLGEIHMAEGNYTEAAAQLESVLRTDDPNRQHNARSRLFDLYVKSEDFAKAKKTAVELLKRDPDSYYILFNLAGVYEKEGDFDGALRVINRLLLKNPGNKDLKKKIFSLYKSQGKLEEKIAELELKRDENSGDPAAYRELTEYYLWDDRPIEALRELEHVVRLQPENINDALLLARLLYENQWKKKALALCEGLLERFPGDLRVWRQIGDIHHSEKRPAEARAAWEKSIPFNPENRESYRQLANFLTQRQLYPDGAEVYEQARKHFKSPELFAMELAGLYEGQLRLTDAVDEYITLLVRGGQSPDYIEQRLLKIASQNEDTAAYAAEALEKNKNRPADPRFAHILLAQVYLLQNDFPTALKLISELHTANPRADPFSAAAHRLARKADYENAAAFFEKAAEKGAPATRPDALFNAAINRRKAGEKQAAMRLLETIVADYPQSHNAPYSLYLLATIHDEEENPAAALTLYERLLAGFPSSQWAGPSRVALVRAHLLTGNPGRAAELLEKLQSTPSLFQDELLFLNSEINFYLGKTDEAKKMYRRLIGSYPESESVNDAIFRLLFLSEAGDEKELGDYLRAELDAMCGETAKAEKALRALAESRSPVRPFASLSLAGILRRQGQTARAIEQLEKIASTEAPADLLARALYDTAEIQLGGGDHDAAVATSQKLFERFPDTFWADAARENLDRIK